MQSVHSRALHLFFRQGLVIMQICRNGRCAREHTAIDLERARLVVSAEYRAVGRSVAAVHHVSRGVARLCRLSPRRYDGEGRRPAHAQPAQAHRPDGPADDDRVQVRMGKARAGEHDAFSQPQARHGAHGAGGAGVERAARARVSVFVWPAVPRTVFGAVSAGHDLADGVYQSGTGHFQYHPDLTARRVQGALRAAA